MARAPSDLSEDGMQFFETVVAEFDLDDHQLNILADAGRLLDRAAAARNDIKVRGLLVANRFNELVENPSVKIERSSMQVFLRLRRELAVDIEPSSGRGPASRLYA